MLATLYIKLLPVRKRHCFLLLDCIHSRLFVRVENRGASLDSMAVAALSEGAGELTAVLPITKSEATGCGKREEE